MDEEGEVVNMESLRKKNNRKDMVTSGCHFPNFNLVDEVEL